MKSLKERIKGSKLLYPPLRHVAWQLHKLQDWWSTRVATGEIVDDGLGFQFSSGRHPAYRQMRAGVFEPEETAIVKSLLGRVDRFVDVGANVGYYTCLALSDGRPVVAFEPQSLNLKYLLANVRRNGWSQLVEVFPLALSDRPGTLQLMGASGPSASLIEGWATYSAKYRQDVAVSTLDRVMEKRYPEEQLLVKIDVEGAELGVLRGADDTIHRAIKPFWLLEICFDEFHPDGINPNYRETFDTFYEAGYRCFAVGDQLSPVTSGDVDAWLQAGVCASPSFNYLFVDEDAEIEVLLEGAG